MSQLDIAISLAVSAHSDQRDLQGIPYILHPLRVMFSLLEDCCERVAIVGVLHDVVEDSKVSLNDLRHEFGDEIADAVDALTRRDGEKYAAYIKRVAENPTAKTVKLADLADNLRRMPHPIGKFAKLERRYQDAEYALTAGDRLRTKGDRG